MLDFIVGMVIGVILGFFALKFVLSHLNIYLNAIYTNGYMDIIVDNCSDKYVECFVIETSEQIRIDKIIFLLQFKLKDKQEE